ncbi:7335_t:CDS:2 [Entrophospora sp. SA101]|nr:9975_t:CDS:2 [Entrophospora sp. SA101]CAJ0751399.1 2071_t:CDS:2 [Entrophospora sp. SA101]CAJ0754706.1 7335_t:CDS:2 [Entrophospora sp. SA101]
MTSTSAPSSKKRSSLSALQKKEPFSVILSESNKWLSVDETVSISQFKKNWQANWPQLEETLAIWFDEVIKHN